MTDETILLLVQARDPEDLADSELDALTRALARELDTPELTEGVAIPGSGTTGPGAKGLGETIGKLVLRVTSETGPALLGFLRDWVNRDKRVKIKVQTGDKVIEGDFDPESTDEEEFEALAGRLLERLRT